ncbi:MAG TPA: hypothetical protein VK622_02145 [Puia sp.]|nr:hypothetical protein [Puia sp.]
MFRKLKSVFWVMSILLCYPLYSLGQLLLFGSKQNEPEIYLRITRHPNEWLNAHLVLMVAVTLMIPAYLGITNYFKGTKYILFAELGIFFICISVFVLFGQYTIDLCTVDLFNLPEKTSYEILDRIQNDTLIKPLFYDNSQLFILLKYFDFTVLGQLCVGIIFILSKKMPRWAIIVFFIALLLTQFGILIHPVYGRIIKRLSYTLFSVSFLPIAVEIIKLNFGLKSVANPVNNLRS